MGERKVLNKYYPPDFNPEKLIKNKRPKDKQDNVRMMLPMSLRCNTCGNYLYIGTKFNMRKETVLNEDYLGIRIYRFYMKCTCCYAEITMKTDPKNHDYIVEHGGSRNYEPWRDAQAAEATLKEIREQEEEGNAMKFLEHKTYDSKKEMDMLDCLDEIKHMNKRKEQITHDQLLKAAFKIEEKQENNNSEDDDKIINEIFKSRKIKRLVEEKEEEEALPQITTTDSDESTRALNINNSNKNSNNGTNPNTAPLKKALNLKVKPIKKLKISNGDDSNALSPYSEKKNQKELNPNNYSSNINKEGSSNFKGATIISKQKLSMLNLCNYSDED